MANPLAISLAASAAHTTSGVGAAVDGSLDSAGATGKFERQAAKLLLDVTAAAGTFAAGEGLAVDVETSPSGAGGSWKKVASFTLIQGVGFERLAFATLERYTRARWTITGTGSPSFTFAVTGDAHTIYATTEDLESLAFARIALASVAVNDKARALLAATSRAASAIQAAGALPITSWGDDLRLMCACYAAYHAINGPVGHRPGPVDESIKDRYMAAESWFDRVAEGQLQPEGLVDATPEEFEGGAYLETEPKRGW